ncbi:TPA: tail fiber assembly protein [Escherichia coli]|uniref:tail fiber assembly protein n=2 Tax=Escherichia coli TaxID=562 RepID=UPI0005424A3E|nr:tail fiber assembly protein [Escherichia coli]ECQ1705376.1 tail fiber assembly protein [Salmonella enterica subsp. enterica serovar Enteritidis]ECR4981346.1 tail fiber assembly protein [Salmonella enterica]EEZ9837868.1 tail fiber assembly protein [Escherichia coli O25]EEN2722909.1 tail fiber assembly protein [Salmonella enterica]EET4403768.1 tail fiber assembly protein [Escherichia coli]
MEQAILGKDGYALNDGEIIVHNYDGETREYISTSTEYLAVGVGIPACSCLDAPGTHKAGYAICRSVDLNSWEYVPDHRGEVVYSTETGDTKEITVPGDYPENTTTIAPLTPYDKWDGEKWMTDTEAQHSAALDAAEAQRQSLINAAMASISLIQLKLQAGRKLTQAETTRLNAVLDYIDAVTATDTSTAPDVIWPELPEA